MASDALAAAGLFALALGVWFAQKRARKPRPALRIAYYITGHGLGHAVRSSALARAFMSRGHRVTLVSAAPKAFFDHELPGVEVRPDIIDLGAIQYEALRIEQLETLEAYYFRIHQNRQEIIDRESRWLAEQHIDIVLSDASPLAGAIAAAAGCKSVAVTNLFWDYIYERMLHNLVSDGTLQPDSDEVRKYRAMIDQVTADYQKHDLFLRLPGDTPTPPSVPIIDGPIIVRKARRPADEVRASMGATMLDRVLLLSFGIHAHRWQLQDGFLPPGWKCWVAGAKPEDLPSDRWTPLPRNSFVPDLVNAADVVLGKVGFGAVSESVAHGTPFIFIPRDTWPEEEFLIGLLHSVGGGVAMPESDFWAGRWSRYLERARAMKPAMRIPASAQGDPNDRAASTILEFLDLGS